MAITPKSLENLKSFKAGQSGNPAGRPKGVQNTKTRLAKLLAYTSEVRNPATGLMEEMTVAEQMDLAIIRQARKGDTRAYNAIIDRIEGKPQQNLAVKEVTDFGELTDEELEKIVNAGRTATKSPNRKDKATE